MEAQQVQQPQQPQQMQGIPPPMPVPLPSGPDDDFFKYRIDGTDILEDIKNQLEGKVFDYTKNKYVKKFDRWINDEGINKVLHVIYACGINKNTFLGNLDREQILYKCKMLKKKLALLFFMKYKDYKIPKEMRDLLIATIVNQVHSALSRSEEGKESDQLSIAHQRHDIHQFSQQQDHRGGMIDKFPALFGGRRG